MTGFLFDDLILPKHADRDTAEEFMRELRRRGPVIGTDEAGRGPLAGPVVAAAAFLTKEQEEALLGLGLRDSKQMTPHARESLFHAMDDLKVLWRVQAGSVARIERDNILCASLWAMGRSANRLAEVLPESPACVIVDGPACIPTEETDLPQWALVAADALLPVVSAASVIAKVIRDRVMFALDRLYPGYGLARHKGYPTADHREAVKRLGLTPAHRRFFCRRLLAEIKNIKQDRQSGRDDFARN